MKRGLLALCVFLARAPLARADMISPGDRCIPVRATFANLDAFPRYRIALVEIQFPGNDEVAGPAWVRFLDEGAALEREPFLQPLRELMAIPRDLDTKGLSTQALRGAGALGSGIVFSRMHVCFPIREPGALEVHAFRVEHLDPPHLGVRLAAVERHDEAGRVAQKYRALPSKHVIKPPDEGPPRTLTLVTQQNGGWRARAVEPGQIFALDAWPPATVVLGAPPPPGASIEAWLQEHRERTTHRPIDPLETLFVPEASSVQQAVIHHSVDASQTPPRLGRFRSEGWDSSGTRYYLDGTGESRITEEPELKGWFAAGIALAMLVAGALLRATRSR